MPYEVGVLLYIIVLTEDFYFELMICIVFHKK